MHKLNLRHYTRINILQVLYAWDFSKNNLNTIVNDFLLKHNSTKKKLIDIIFFKEVIEGINHKKINLDKILKNQILPKNFNLSNLEYNILIIATYELLYCHEIPYKVIINEAIELTKTFGTTNKSYKFINNLLDKLLYYLKKKT